MRVQVNGRYLAQRITGVQRYARQIVELLADRFDVVRPAVGATGPAGHVWEQFVLPARMNRGLLWSPSSTGPLGVRDQVVTIHDAAFVDQAQCFSRAFAAWYQWLVPRLARRVRRIITVSVYSQERLAEYCRVPREKIVVIPSGVDSRFRPGTEEEVRAAKEQLGLPDRYLLCVGSLEPRKNLARLLSAWKLLPYDPDGLQLVLVGTKGRVFRDADLDTPPGVHWTGYLNDDTLPAVYAGAESFIFPSIYEGFGFPVLEAMACGTPVICSGATSLPEVAGDAALYVDPLNIESIAQGIRTLAENPPLRWQMRAQGLSRASQFSWRRAAAATWQTLEEAGP